MGSEKTIGHRGLVVNAFPMNGFCAAVSRIKPAGETSGRTFNPVTEVSQCKLLTVILGAVNIRFLDVIQMGLCLPVLLYF